jgi:hypothetical protein
VIVGSAVGALIGLQFAVMTLVAQKPVIRTREASFGVGAAALLLLFRGISQRPGRHRHHAFVNMRDTGG